VNIPSLLQPVLAQTESAPHAAPPAAEQGVDIIGHVANSPHALIHLPTIFGIDFSVTKHVLMLWLVALLVFLIVTTIVRRYLRFGGICAPASSCRAAERTSSK
jgi:hypothetical protein